MYPYIAYLLSPIGWVAIESNDTHIGIIRFVDTVDSDSEYLPDCLLECRSQLLAYFEGQLLTFDLPLAPAGTEFQMRVWNSLLQIPYGQTATYSHIATALGDVKATRAVGMANGSNPIAIVIPCHRVIGADGSLTGYAGGMERKRWLLRLEALTVGMPQGKLF